MIDSEPSSANLVAYLTILDTTSDILMALTGSSEKTRPFLVEDAAGDRGS